jgi:hypothetical protein
MEIEVGEQVSFYSHQNDHKPKMVVQASFRFMTINIPKRTSRFCLGLPWTNVGLEEYIHF